ncbi:mucin-5AC isoform X1 [Drosophila yakuba]|uniref:mucin-5AC isoform X1 n=1 Tax=Drosophila yakuba TaxID=7245 RepID=UPI001930811B|nr:mucin-5AC isoform X1 [Drosophila yakuba]XP_039233393.1 mucin-5AC isoform X1 [Drosophila yakuba]
MLPFRRGAAWQTLFLLCALAYCINEASSEGRVVCYYTNWSVYRPGTAKFNPQNINPYLCTHLVYAFGGFTKDNQMKPFDKYQDIEQGGYAKFTGLKTYNKQLKTMIAIGGWNEASSRFSPLVASNERRQQFIKNILKFLRQNHFDGIDLDWEYPAHREGGKSRDRDNYAQFVQELRAEFEREAEKTGRTRLLLTMAVPAGIEYIDKGYDVPKLNKYLDWFNVLTYDFHSSHEPSVNHHAPLYSLEEDSEYNYDAELNIDYSIKYYLKAGADRDKLVLGIPTYGRSYTLINEESTELGAPAEGPGEQGDATREKGYLAYYEICQTLKDDPEWTVVQPNANVMGPYAYRRNQWVGYDDEAIVRKKAEYVVAQGLGGIMFWAIDNDDFRGTCNGKPYPLIEAAKEAMVEALGLGINEVAKPSGPQKPSRSRSRDNASTRNRLNGKTEAPPSSRRPSATRRPTVSSTQPPPPSTTFKLTEAEGSSLYIGGRASTTPPPPTTPDPGSDFKCEEEGFFQHPRDCKKYYWCLDSGPSGLGIVAHMFTCPSGLYFNPAADSCDFARNVPCKTKKSTTAAPVTSTTPTTTTVRSNRVTAAPTARPVYPRTTTTTSTTTTTTTTTPASVDEDLEYEEDTDELSPSKSSDAEEDPQVIKELIDLIRKVGGVEQLEKHLLRNKDGSITLKENSATGAATTPSTISKSLYDRVLSRPGTLNSFSRNRFKISEATETSTEATVSSSSSKGPSTLTSNSNSKYSSVLRGNSRQGPQNEGIEKLAEFDGFLKERKQYVTINRHRSASQGDDEELADQQEEEENLAEVQTTTRRPLSSITPSYTSLRRARPTTVAPPAEESNVEAEQNTQTQVKSYATLSRTRGRTTAPPEVTEAAPSSTTNRYKYFERTRPTKSAAAEDSEDPTEDEEEEYEDEQKDIVTVQSKQTTNTRKYASIGRRTTTTTTATPETTRTTAGTETAKASTTTTNNNNNNHYNSSNNNNNAKLNNQIPTEENIPTTPSTTAQSDTTTTTNETTEPNESTSTTTTSITNNLHTITTTTTTPTPIVASTVPTTAANGISSDSLLATELSEASPTHLSPSPDLETSTPTTTSTTTTTTEPELDTTTTTPKTTPTTTTTTGNNELNDVNNVDEDSEVTKTKTQYKYATTNRRRITTTTTTTNKNSNNNNNNNAEAANDASPTTTNGLSSLNSIRTNPGRRQPPQSEQTQTTTTEPNLSSPRPFGYPRRRTRPTASTTTTTIPQTDNDNNTDNNVNETDAVAQVVKKTRLSPGDRPKNRYQLSRTRGSTTNTTPTTATTTTQQQQQQPQTTTTARRLTFGGRQRAQVTKLTLVDEQTEETETKGVARDEEEKEEEEDSNATTTTSTTTTTTSRPTPKRIRVLKFRRPLNSNSNSTTTNVDSTTNSATDTNPDTTTATPTTAGQSTTTSNNNTTSTTGNKRFRKIVRKLRPVDSSTAASVDSSDETTRKTFVPSHTRFADQDNDLVNLRQRIKEQQARGEPQDGVISSRFKTLGQKDDQDVSELQKLRDKVKAEQARGEGERGVINDRLKKLLAEKGSSISSQREESSTDDDSSSVSSARPFFKRKLVARRPYTPPSASGGGTTKAPLTFSTTRPTAKFVRRKNGRFDPFNSSVRNRGEGFVRSDPRGSRLPGTDRFKSQGNNEDDDEVEERREQPLQNQFATTLRRPFVPKTRPVLDKAKPQQEDGAEDSEEEDEEEDSEEDGDEEEDEEEEEEQKEKPEVEEESPQGDNKPTINTLYKPKDNRAPPGSRPTFGTTGSGSPPTASGNVPFNPRNRPSSSANANNTPSNRFGTTKRPRVVNRPPGVASPNLTLKPVASDYERTTPLTPLKPAPFIPSNNRSYERKYSGPSTEAAETSSENSLIEDLNIDALNARNKKIFDKHSKKHPALKPKVVKVESETGLEVETGTEVAVEEETTEVQQLEQGFVTTTPSTPPSPPAPPSTQSDTATTTDTPPETKTETEPETEPETETEIETEIETENVTEIETATNANEATSVNSQDQTISSTTQAPPPATTLLHVFTLLEGEGQEEEPTTRKPTVRLYPTIQTEVVPKHKLVEINRIVEINSKQAKASQRKSKANNDFGVLMVESLPHVEQLGEISVVKYVHLVDGSDIQINDGHSTVADYTPTEPTSAAQSPVSLPVRNSLPETEGADTDRSGKSLVPEVLTAALETSTISLEGLFDSARKGKQLSSNTIIGETEESTTIGSSSSSATETGETTTPAPTYVRPIVPLLRPESNESSPLVISIANLDQVILSKVQNSQTTVAPEAASDSNSAFSVRQPLVVQAPISSGAQAIDILNTQDQAINGAIGVNIDSVIQTTTTRPNDDQVAEETTIFSIETATEPQLNTQTTTPKTEANGETLTAMPIGAVIMGQFGQNTQSTTTTVDNDNQLNTQTTSSISSGAVSSEAIGGDTQTTNADNDRQENTQSTGTTTSEISSGAISTDNNHTTTTTQTTATGNSSETTPTQTLTTISEPIDGSPNLSTQTTTTNNSTTSTTAVGSKVSEAVSFSSETHVVHRKKMGRKGRGRRLRNRKTTTTTTTTTETPTTETPTTVEATFDDTTTVVPE